MAEMSNAQRDEFLSATRYAILTHHDANGAPISVPVWYGWDGRTVEMFTHVSTPKMRHLQSDARAAVLITNFPHERETWIRFEGEVTFGPGGLEIAERLLDRYWPEGDPRRAMMDEWRQHPDEWPKMGLVPRRIVTHRE